MDISKVRGKSQDMLKAEFFDYLQTKNYKSSTVKQYSIDVFYLWNHGNEKLFWEIVASESYRKWGYTELEKLLLKDSEKPVTKSRISGYLTAIRHFRDFIQCEE